jgi:uncharacterized protein (DUF885 family)
LLTNRSFRAVLLLGALASIAAAPAPPAADALRALFAESWALALKEDPLFATSVGENRYNDRLPSFTHEDIERGHRTDLAYLDRLHAIDRAQLNDTDKVSYDLFERDLQDGITEYGFKTYRMGINAEGAFHTGFSQLPNEMPFATVKDYENYLARLRAFPTFGEQNTALLREGIVSGMTVPKIVLNGFTDGIKINIVEDAHKSVFWAPFDHFPKAIAAADRERLSKEAERVIHDDVIPVYRHFLNFMETEYLPRARTTIAASDLPDGKNYYAARVRHFTTLDLTPEQVHQIGLKEVERIHAEMLTVMAQVDFKGDLKAFFEFLHTDPRFYPKTGDELLKDAAYIAKRMDGKLPSLFRVLPRQPYGIEPVPADLAPKYTAGRYSGAPITGRRAGMYWVNTTALNSRTLYTLEALTFHESVPGHHLQGALEQELTDLPDFRRFDYVETFGEGWGLYSEFLGIEAGFYTDPYSNFGRLTYEMWRACRLVVDTGMHSFGWSRQKAMEYMAANTALSPHEIETETDRYIGWPGQALAYKIGEMKIKELRREAEKELGDRFDIRDFHQVVLGSGTVTMPILEHQVHDWIARTKANTGK